jgi:hypothetical protein
MLNATDIRLPGVYFLPTPAAADRGLPPLDVAAFVGFAERGPLHTPVMVEDIATYRAIFGGDLPLALGPNGRIAYANLPTAVSAFFANGGRRCYVVRVAGNEASRSQFRLPNLVSISPDGQPYLTTVMASSVGGWSAQLRLATRLDATPLPPNAFTISGDRSLGWFTGSAPRAIRPGDLLHLALADGDWLFPVAAVSGDGNDDGRSVLLDADSLWRLHTPPQPPAFLISDSPPTAVAVDRLTTTGSESLAPTAALSLEAGHFWLYLDDFDTSSIMSGDMLHLKPLDESETDGLLFPVQEVQPPTGTGSPPSATGRLGSSQLLLLDPDQSLPLDSPPTAWRRIDRLRFDLHLWQGQAKQPPLLEMAFNSGHPSSHARFWGETVLTESGTSAGGSEMTAGRAASIYHQLQQEQRSRHQETAVERQMVLAGLLAPLAAERAAHTHLPLQMAAILSLEARMGPVAVGQDDLESFDPAIFVDNDLVPDPERPSLSGAALLSQAFHKYYVQDRRLRGMHSLLFVDEIALLAVPDAAQQPWPAASSEPLTATPKPAEPAEQPPTFIDCQQPPLITAVIPNEADIDGQIPVTITGAYFDDTADTAVTFGQQPATDVQVINSRLLTCTLPPAPARGLVDVSVSNRHATTSLPAAFTYQQTTVPLLPPLQPLAENDQDDPHLATLLPIQQALITLAQARRDAVAILSLPRHFDKRLCIEWLERLRRQLGLPSQPLPLWESGSATADLSYTAVYHPWLLIEDQGKNGRLRPAPPDGFICGAIARRERQRQVWVAPANIPLQGVVGLDLSLNADDWADLFDFHFNLIRAEARDFRPMSAHTLSDDRHLRQLSVRRLMILLRKLAQEQGMDFVFENNDARLREGLQLALEIKLQSLFALGAFAGRSPQQAFRVVTGSSINSRQSIEQGQFIAQIQVAPSQPMEFMTVLLLRQNEGLLQAMEQ